MNENSQVQQFMHQMFAAVLPCLRSGVSYVVKWGDRGQSP